MSTSRTIVGMLALGAALVHAGRAAQGGECLEPERCEEPCPSELSCFGDEDCSAGMVCRDACLPYYCGCSLDGVWECLLDCAGECVPRPEGPPSYTIVDLGTLGGTGGVALAINDRGQVAGGADTSAGLRHAFLWDSGEMTDLGTLPGWAQSEAWDVNDLGQVVGLSTTTGSISSAFIWTDGKMIDLGHLTGLPTGDTEAFGINDAGQVVGTSIFGPSEHHAFLWEGGSMYDLGTLGGDLSIAWDINVDGQVVGMSFTKLPGEHAFFWQGGVMTDVGTLGGAGSVAYGISGLGQVVGRAGRSDGITSAFLWEAGKMSDLGAQGEFSSSRAWAINDAGQVIGSPGFLYDPNKGMQDLWNLIPPDSGWSELSPRDINDAGQIVGSGTFDGIRRPFLMTPIPPPPVPAASEWSIIAMTLVLGAGVAAIARRSAYVHPLHLTQRPVNEYDASRFTRACSAVRGTQSAAFRSEHIGRPS